MQILAASLNVEVGSFLHAGYISAYPRTFHRGGHHFLASSKAKLIDVKKAVELKDPKDQTASTTAVEVASPALPAAIMVSDVCVLAITFFFFAYLISLYYRRRRKSAKPTWRPWLFAGVPILIFVCIHYWAWPTYQAEVLNDLPPPWQGMPIKEYRDPQAATEAILHALVANGLLGVAADVRCLAAIQNEVAFPVAAAEYTAGMKYAQTTYGRDGWGREFSFERLANGEYQITSAGPDGTHRTKDDIALVTPATNKDWEQRLGGVFFRVAGGREVVLIHRVDHPHFVPANLQDAQKLTGTDLFDSFGLDALTRGYRDPAKGEWPIVAALKNRLKPDSGKDNTDELLYVRYEGNTHE